VDILQHSNAKIKLASAGGTVHPFDSIEYGSLSSLD
jgi:hypothetical protein